MEFALLLLNDDDADDDRNDLVPGECIAIGHWSAEYALPSRSRCCRPFRRYSIAPGQPYPPSQRLTLYVQRPDDRTYSTEHAFTQRSLTEVEFSVICREVVYFFSCHPHSHGIHWIVLE